MIISAGILLSLWLPGILSKKTAVSIPDKPKMFKSFSSSGDVSPAAEEDDIQEVAKPGNEASKTDWKVTITWIIGSLNGLLLVISQAQKLFIIPPK